VSLPYSGMTRSSLQDGEDTLLARKLHAAGALSVDQLTPLLSEARAQRERDPQASLARLLVERGLVHQAELQLHQSAGDTLAQGLIQAPQRGPALRVGGQFAGYELEEVLGRAAAWGSCSARAKRAPAGRSR